MIIKSKTPGYLIGFVVGILLIAIGILGKYLFPASQGIFGPYLVESAALDLLKILGGLVIVVFFILGIIDLVKSKKHPKII